MLYNRILILYKRVSGKIKYMREKTDVKKSFNKIVFKRQISKII